MSNKLHLSIPTPCHEDWQGMAPADKGRFCTACQKTVVDFTMASDKQIAEAFKAKGNLCGRFRNDQLERDLIIPKEKNSLWMAASAAVVSFLTLGSNEAVAQQPVKTEQAEPVFMNGVEVSPVVISGIVTDNGGPLPGAPVINLTTKDSTLTSIDGLFRIKARYGDVIEVTYFGLKSTQFIAAATTRYTILLEPDHELIDEIVVGMTDERFTTTQPSYFFHNLFHSIGNLFRKKDE